MKFVTKFMRHYTHLTMPVSVAQWANTLSEPQYLLGLAAGLGTINKGSHRH